MTVYFSFFQVAHLLVTIKFLFIFNCWCLNLYLVLHLEPRLKSTTEVLFCLLRVWGLVSILSTCLIAIISFDVFKFRFYFINSFFINKSECRNKFVKITVNAINLEDIERQNLIKISVSNTLCWSWRLFQICHVPYTSVTLQLNVSIEYFNLLHS